MSENPDSGLSAKEAYFATTVLAMLLSGLIAGATLHDGRAKQPAPTVEHVTPNLPASLPRSSSAKASDASNLGEHQPQVVRAYSPSPESDVPTATRASLWTFPDESSADPVSPVDQNAPSYMPGAIVVVTAGDSSPRLPPIASAIAQPESTPLR